LNADHEDLNTKFKVILDSTKNLPSREDLNSLQSDLNAATAENKRISNENTSLTESVANVKSLNQKYNDKCKQQASDIKELQKKIEALEQTIDSNKKN